MIEHFLPSRRRAGYAVASVAALAVAGLAGSTSYAAGAGAGGPRASITTSHVRATGGEQRGFYDARSQAPNARQVAAVTAEQPAVTTFKATLPGQSVLDLDPTTGTVRMLTRLDGFLTGASHRGAPRVARHYVAQHHAALGLTRTDLRTLHLRRNYVDIAGTHHLYWTQRIGGRQVISNGLTAAVDKRGHLLTVGGSPISKSRAGKVPTGTGRIATASQALTAARQAGQVSAGADLGNDFAERGLFLTPSGLHLAWRTVALSASRPAERVVDATTGQLLLQHPLTNFENSNDSTGKVFRFFPKAKHGGRQVRVDFTRHGWLGRRATVLKGNNSHAYSDVNDDNRPEKSEEVKAQSGHAWSYLLKPFHPSLPGAGKFCSNPWPCSWDPDTRRSWQTNRAQNATQVFYFVNNWHDHLKKAPIGFTNAAGNFQASNGGTQGKGGDAVATETDDGANTAGGLPDSSHIDNANMSTPPDGHAPTMQMYLQHEPGTSYPTEDPFSPTNVGDEADTVYHEYTHGLSNRLDVDVQGFSTLGNVQAGAMGEAWSDWYAMDYLVKQGLQKDRPGKVDVRLFRYDGVGVNFDRTEPIDCAVSSKAHLCNGGRTGHRGGYTYADYGKVVGGPEVHSDGEIWAQTLWSLRHKLGSRKTESLVTRAMELAPYNPSFLDMRNAILVADTSLYKGVGRANIWRVFASRGMGFFAGSLGGNDSAPGASFATPPKQLALRTVQGTVTDSSTHAPLAGVPVTLAFQGKGVVNPTAVTDATGHYAIHGVPEGVYRKLQVTGGGFEPTRVTVRVGPSGATSNLSARRDWAAASGGATVQHADGVDYSVFGCGPRGAIDLSQATGWSTNAGPGTNDSPTSTFHAKQIVINLHHAVNVTGFGVDPEATCSDGASASTGQYEIDTSPDNVSWTPEHSGTFTAADNGRINAVPADTSPTGVQYVRFTIVTNQVPDFAQDCPAGGFDGCQFADLTELEVFGTPGP
ncbi:M36 family metallopeptidase [Nocardioides cynanchi]|uniref:M36 family metallopeptidase n=1 Tax=Nocardioides cynanchi TaxID=2558918 RepID=UPI0012492FDB|nr:M36 family metallopeptidase [Nocardioides cynanchi]